MSATPIIGVTGPEVTTYLKEHSLASALTSAGPFLWKEVRQQLRGIKAILTGQMSVREMSGPVGLTKVGSELMARGLAMTLLFTVLINLALAIMNLIPLPVLDGGQILFGIYKVIFRKEFNLDVRMALVSANWALLMLAVVAITIKDVWQIAVA